MEVRFAKGKRGRTCGWTALLPPRTRVSGPTMAAGGDVPHDLATFVIEAELEIEHGFWGCVADGARFRSLRRNRTEQGRAVIQRHRRELDSAEVRVNATYFAWRRGEATPANDALDQMLTRWRSLAEGDELLLQWDVAKARRSRARR